MNKPIIKNSVLLGIPAIVAALGIVISSNWLPTYNGILIVFAVVITIVYIFFVFYYSGCEQKEKKKQDELNEEIGKLKATISSMSKILNLDNSIVSAIIELLEPWNNNINKIANDIKATGQANEKDWDYEKICGDICVSCKNAIAQFVGPENGANIAVALVRYYLDDSENEYVKMIAHSGSQIAKPNVFDIQELLRDCNYQYAKLIREKNRSIYVLETPSKIQSVFYKKRPETNLSKYSQYIAIPIVCSKGKYLGVLQITAENGCQIMKTEDELLSFCKSYITPFGELLILVEKIHKGIFATPIA